MLASRILEELRGSKSKLNTALTIRENDSLLVFNNDNYLSALRSWSKVFNRRSEKINRDNDIQIMRMEFWGLQLVFSVFSCAWFLEEIISPF